MAAFSLPPRVVLPRPVCVSVFSSPLLVRTPVLFDEAPPHDPLNLHRLVQPHLQTHSHAEALEAWTEERHPAHHRLQEGVAGGRQEVGTLGETPELGGRGSDGQEDPEGPPGEQARPPIRAEREGEMRQRFW